MEKIEHKPKSIFVHCD